MNEEGASAFPRIYSCNPHSSPRTLLGQLLLVLIDRGSAHDVLLMHVGDDRQPFIGQLFLFMHDHHLRLATICVLRRLWTCSVRHRPTRWIMVGSLLVT